MDLDVKAEVPYCGLFDTSLHLGAEVELVAPGWYLAVGRENSAAEKESRTLRRREKLHFGLGRAVKYELYVNNMLVDK
jgi:hypothetical protein